MMCFGCTFPRNAKGKRRWKEDRKEKEECKKQWEELKKKKDQAHAEAKAKKEAERIAMTQVKAIGEMGTRKRKPNKKYEVVEVESSEPSPSYDDSSSSMYKISDEGWNEGFINTCCECFKQFRGEDKKLAIGCDTLYCRRWYHQECIKADFDVTGLTKKQIQKKKFVCRYCWRYIKKNYYGFLLYFFIL